jgi:DNA primase
MVQRFGLGYAPAAWDTLYRAMQKQGFSHDLLVQSGLAVVRESQRGGAYDRFRHRLIFPIYDRLGRPIAFGGRALESSEAGHVPKYLNSPETPIFHKSRILYGFALAKAALRQREQALIMEGYTDVIACHRQGVTQAVGTLGTALTEHHVGLLKGLVKEAVLVFDGDAAGGAATERSIGLFLDAGMRVRVVTLPEGDDPDSFLRQHTGEEFLQYVHDAVSFVDYLLARAGRFADLRQPTGQADCVDRLVPLLRKIDNQIERWHYVTRVAEKLGLPPDILAQQLSPHATPSGPALYQRPARPSRPPHAKPISAEYALLQLLCHDLHVLPQVQDQMTSEDFQDADLGCIYTALLGLAAGGRQTAFPHILEAVTSARQTELLNAMWATEPVPTSPTEIGAAVRDCLNKIRQQQLKVQRQRIKEQLRTVGNDSVEQERLLLQTYNRLSKEQPIGSS